MGETTSNDNKAIVTNKTKHVAQNPGDTDPCFDADNTKTTKDFKNEIPSTDLKSFYTTKTLIDGANIMNSRTEIGPPSKGDDPNWEIGVKSTLPVNNKVWAASFSDNVKVEGFWAVRTDDATWQNGGNSKGTMDGSQLDGNEKTANDYAKLKCSMKELTGTSGERKLFKRSMNATQLDYIEILSDEKVDFVATRYDATDVTGKPPLDPKCELEPTHTIWKIKRKGAGIDWEDEAEGKTYTLELSTWTWGGEGKAEDADTWDDKVSANEGGDFTHSTEKTKVTAKTDLGAIIKHIAYFRNPVYINVDAIACSGTKTAIVRVFPKDKLTYSMSVGVEDQSTTKRSNATKDALVDNLYRYFGGLKTLVSKLAGVVGIADVELVFTLFKGFKMELQIGYEHCTATGVSRNRRWYSKEAHVGMVYSFSISAEKLIEIGVEVRISLLKLIATFIGPGVVTAVVEKIEDIFGKPLELVFTAKVSLGFSFVTTCDRLDATTNTGSLFLKPSVTLSLELKLQNAEASLGGGLYGGVTIKNTKPAATHFLKITATGTLECKAWVEGKVKGRILWIGPEYDMGGRKDFEIFKLESEFGSIDLLERGTPAA